MTAEINPAIRLYIKRIYFSYFSLQKYLHLYIFYRNSSEKEISMLETNFIQQEISKEADRHFTPASRKENMHQSTYSPNLPFRNLQYVSAIYAGMVSQDRIYGAHPLQLPAPRFIVFYNGPDKDLPDRTELKLSDLFEKSNTGSETEPWMELKTIILNINKGHNEQLMKTCQILQEYTELVSRIRYYQKDMAIEDAVTCAIDECISEGILSDFLRKNRREAIQVSVLECDVDKVMEYLKQEAKEDGHAEGLAAGLAEGRIKGRIESQLSSIQAVMKSLNMTPTHAMEILNIPEEERENLLEQLNV